MVKQDASSEIKNSDWSQATFNQCLASANQIDFLHCKWAPGYCTLKKVLDIIVL